MGKTKIDWTDMVWNPVTGCSPVSSGCENCYARRMHERHLWSNDSFSKVTLHPERLEQPLHWRKPRRVFVDSMGDLFHEAVPDGFIDRVFAVMALSPRHCFQLLTKRPARMLEYLNGHAAGGRHIYSAAQNIKMPRGLSKTGTRWPLRNVWLGVSVEDQKTADERIPLLLQTPAALRFVSIEPTLGPVNLSGFMPGPVGLVPRYQTINWVIAGGETGPTARPMHPAWAINIMDQCHAAGVPFFFKQQGEWARLCDHLRYSGSCLEDVRVFDGQCQMMAKVGKRVAGHLLDGREWREVPR